jgi:O-Antigen ligase
VPIGWWRGNGVIDYFHRHLGYDYHGTGRRLEPGGAVYGLPENFIYNVGGDKPFLRRLVSSFLSPLASGYLFVVALLVAQWLRSRALVVALSLVTFAGLLWTFSRSSLVALALGIAVLGLLRRRPGELIVALSFVIVAVTWAHIFPRIAPTGHFTKVDLAYQHRVAAAAGGRSGSFSATSPSEPSLSEHWRSLKDGARTMVHHPQGYGLGNVGQTASRTGTALKAGESNYTELGVELGVLGAILFLAWGVALLARAAVAGLDDRWAASVAASFAAVLALAVQTDVIGDPWVAYCVWALAGIGATRARKWPDSATMG